MAIATSEGFKMTNITGNGGLLPIALGKARVENSTHLLIHYLDLSELLNEYHTISNYFLIIRNGLNKSGDSGQGLENYFKIFKVTAKSINETLGYIIRPTRSKRGIINGLGSIVKFVTGNLDHDDGTKFSDSLDKLKETQHNLELQVRNQYSISNNIIVKFNETIKDIKHNELALLGRMDLLSQVTTSNKDQIQILYAENVMNQLLNLLSIMLNIVQNIRDSLTLCRLKIMHNSIISSEDLISEIRKIGSFYKSLVPFKAIETNIQNYLQLIVPHCEVVGNEVIYALELPVFSKKEYHLLQFLPVPTTKSLTIIPNFHFALFDELKLIPLQDACPYVNEMYLCKTPPGTLISTTCELGALKRNLSGCHSFKIKKEMTLEFLPHANKYVTVLPNITRVAAKCENSWTTNDISGVYLIPEENGCLLEVNGIPLIFNGSHPKRNFELELHLQNQPEVDHQVAPDLQLRNVRLGNINSNWIPFAKSEKTPQERGNWGIAATLLVGCCIWGAALHLKSRRAQEHASEEMDTNQADGFNHPI